MPESLHLAISSSCLPDIICRYCRAGFTSRCANQILFGSEALSGGQAQYVRVPQAGGILFVLKSAGHPGSGTQLLHELSDTSILLMADILPTGVFTALQTLQHPNVLPVIRGERVPIASVRSSLGVSATGLSTGLDRRLEDPVWPSMQPGDRILNLAIVGLGPVGTVGSLLLHSLRVSIRYLFSVPSLLFWISSQLSRFNPESLPLISLTRGRLTSRRSMTPYQLQRAERPNSFYAAQMM